MPTLARLAVVTLLVSFAACGRTRPSAGSLAIMEADAGGDAVDPALCAGLDECTCSQTPGCRPLTTACYCPPAACGATTATTCPCTGGRFLACNPRVLGCHTQCGLFAEPSADRDARGCASCVDPPDCASAVARMPAVCPDAPPVDAQWLCGGAYGPCAAICVVQLETCASASCALCEGCDCGNDLFASCLYECLGAT